MVLLFFVAFHSCRKEMSAPLTEKERGERLLAAARKWYNGNRSLPVSNSPGDISVRGLKPDWDAYRIVTNSKRQRVIGIPISMDGARFAEINVIVLRGRVYGTIKRYELDAQGEIRLNFYSGSGRLRRQGYYDDKHHVFLESLSPREVRLLKESPLLKTMDIAQEIIELEEVVITPPDDDDDDDWWDWPEDPDPYDPWDPWGPEDPCAIDPNAPECGNEGDPYFPSEPVTEPEEPFEPEDPEDPEPEEDPLVEEFCDGMSQGQKDTINTMLAELKTYNCATKYIYNSFEAQEASFNFCISGNGNGNATYTPATKSFAFSNTIIASMVHVMEHEFIHAYQDEAYPNGTSAYGHDPLTNERLPGFVNIEFEQAVMNDIIHNANSAFVGYGSPEQLEAYDAWIDLITNSNTEYPKLVPNGTPEQVAFYNDFMASYNGFLAQFNAIDPNYSSTALDLSPFALISLFNNINPNCP